MKILTIFNLDARYAIWVLDGISSGTFFSYLPETIMICIVIIIIIKGRSEFFPLPIIMGIYLWLLFINLCYYKSSPDHFLRSTFLNMINISITFFGLFISFVLKEKHETKILFILLVVFLNTLITARHLMSFFICLEAASFTIFMLSVFGTKTVVKVESAIKYFIITAISSSIMLFSMGLISNLMGGLDYATIKLYFVFTSKTAENTLPLILFFFGLLLKIGLFPGYTWVADVAEGINYSTFLLINILMKFTILIFIKLTFFKIFPVTILFVYIGSLSYMIGVFITLMQRKLVRFLAFGSVANIGFVFTLFYLTDISFYSLAYLVIYFMSLYKMIILLEFTIFNTDKIVYITDLSQLLDLDIRALFTFNILEIGGFPPYNLFILKIIFIFFLIKNNFFNIACFFLLLSVISTFYYIRLIKNLYYDLNTEFSILMKDPYYQYCTMYEFLLVTWMFTDWHLYSMNYTLLSIFISHIIMFVHWLVPVIKFSLDIGLIIELYHLTQGFWNKVFKEFVRFKVYIWFPIRYVLWKYWKNKKKD